MWGFLNLFGEALGWFQIVRSERNGIHGNQSGERGSSYPENQMSLRPPTIALDMLFLLAIIAFLEMNPVSESVISHAANLPTADKSAGAKPVSPLALRPVQSGSGWLYQTPDGQNHTAAEVADRVRAKNMTPVLVIHKTASIQNYLDSQQPLMRQGLSNVGLAAGILGDKP